MAIEEHGLNPDLTCIGVDAVVECEYPQGSLLPGAVPDEAAALTGGAWLV